MKTKNAMRFFNNYIHFSTLIILAVINTSRSSNIPQGEVQINNRISDIIAENVLQFGHNVGLKLADINLQDNSEIFSPLSLVAALSLLTLGAKGRSYQELEQILGLNADRELIHDRKKYHKELALMLNDVQHTNVNNDGVTKRPNANWRDTALKQTQLHFLADNKTAQFAHLIKVTNGLFVTNGYTLNPDYSQVLQSIYRTKFARLDFRNRPQEAREYINSWINKATYGKIPEMINYHIHASTTIILASALYFRARWEKVFTSGATREDNFYPDGANNLSVKVQMMVNLGTFPFYDSKEYDCSIIGLPYKDNETTMYIIQPNNSSRKRLSDLQQVLDASKINNMIDRMERKTAMVKFPKMHFTRRIDMRKILQTMNVNDIFLPGYSDLSLVGLRSPENNAAPAPEITTTESIPISFEAIYRETPVYQSANKQYEHKAPYFPPDPASLALSNLESDRQKIDSYRANLYVDDIVHNVDFLVNEEGTEAAATTHYYYFTSGPEVNFVADSPFLVVVRHDPTKLPLFFGIINRPDQ